IEANRNRPFFMYLAFNAPHTPLQATRADYDALPQIKDHKTRVYGAMIAQMDRGIGAVMAKLKAEGLDDNTLVIFTSDNGGAWYTGIDGLNAPYRGWKATFFEGGIRTPLFMRWPAKIAAGSRRTDVTGHIDLFSTIAGAAGAGVPADRVIDSENVLAGPARRPALFWRSGAYRAVRAGDWKLQVTARPAKDRLYNLADDPTEKNDLSASQPQRVAAMRALLERQNRGMAKPIWPGLIEGPVRIDVAMNAPWKDGQDYVYWTN
ncbi:MAG: sulfatase-like hydrolase/transferase, partial [Sphingomonadaceae bacterium]|nr:sulfatase-like hydrolase/transferase [Sphingomonadaceae bacterium]